MIQSEVSMSLLGNGGQGIFINCLTAPAKPAEPPMGPDPEARMSPLPPLATPLARGFGRVNKLWLTPLSAQSALSPGAIRTLPGWDCPSTERQTS